METVRRVLRTVVLLALVISIAAIVPSNKVIAQSGTSTSTAALSPCKFDVGIGQSKYQVDAECTTVQVPEDYSKPDDKQLDLHVVVLRATGLNKQPTPVFHFEGGPGASAIQNFGQTFYAAYREIRKDHDIVLIDQRGTGSSSSLQCTEVTDPAIKDLNVMGTDQDAALFSKRMSACLERLSKTTDPAHYNSMVAADDTDVVRQALGFDQIDVYGNSYGTWLAQIYLGRHGAHVHAMLLDSVAGPWNFYMLDAGANAEAAINKIFDLCKADRDCNRAYPNLPATMKKVLDQLDKEPARTFGTGTLTGQTYPVIMTKARFLEVIRSMMYQSANISAIPQIVNDAANGHFTLAAAGAVLAAEVAPQISLGYYYSVHCAESLPFITPAEIAKYDLTKFYGASESTMDEFRAACNSWRAAELDEADVAPVKSDRPVLIYVGAFDPITSVGFGEETHKRLSNSALAVFPFQAHGPIVGSKCAQVLADKFFGSPDKRIDTSCTANDIKPKFLGAYSLDLVNYTDPNGRFTARIPRGWAYQKDVSTEHIAFFASPDGNELMGIGIFKNTGIKAAEKEALDTIDKTYGAVDVQLSQTVLFISVLQHALDRPNDASVGLLMSQNLGPNTTLLWIAAPSNVVQALVVPATEQIFTSIVPK